MHGTEFIVQYMDIYVSKLNLWKTNFCLCHCCATPPSLLPYMGKEAEGSWEANAHHYITPPIIDGQRPCVANLCPPLGEPLCCQNWLLSALSSCQRIIVSEGFASRWVRPPSAGSLGWVKRPTRINFFVFGNSGCAVCTARCISHPSFFTGHYPSEGPARCITHFWTRWVQLGSRVKEKFSPGGMGALFLYMQNRS